MKFVSAVSEVRSGIIPPIARAFDLNEWISHFNRLNDGSEEDFMLFNFGRVTHEQILRITATVDALEEMLKPRTFHEMSSLFATELNRTQKLVFAPLIKLFKEAQPMTYDALRTNTYFVDSHKNEHAPIGIMEAAVDAIEQALSEIWYNKVFGTRDSQNIEEFDFAKILKHRVELALRRADVKRIWDGTVWYKAKCVVQPYGSSYFINEESSDIAKRAIIDVTRRAALIARDLDEVAEVAKSESIKNVLIPILRQDAHESKLEVVAVRDMPGQLPKITSGYLASSASLQEITLIPFLKAVHPTVELTVADMLNVWNQLGVIALQFEDRFYRSHPNYPYDGPEENAKAARDIGESYIERSNVLDVFSVTLSLPRDAIDRCLDFFTFEPGKGKTLWDRPLLNVRDGFSLIWWPLTAINHGRVLSRWAKIDKAFMAKFDEKGNFNELVLHKAVERAILSGPYKRTAHLIGANLRPQKKPDEEIDLAFTLGQTLFVIEAASVQHPAEPFEFFEMETRLDKKAKQCRQRINYLEKDSSQIEEWLRKAKIDLKINRMQGLVVTNSYLRDGTFQDDIIYIHWDTLFTLLSYGGFSFGLMRSDGSQYDLFAHCCDFGDEMQDVSFIKTLRYSPKSEFYLRALKQTTSKTKQFDCSDVSGIYAQWRVVIPESDQLDAFLRSCSFSERLVEYKFKPSGSELHTNSFAKI